VEFALFKSAYIVGRRAMRKVMEGDNQEPEVTKALLSDQDIEKSVPEAPQEYSATVYVHVANTGQ